MCVPPRIRSLSKDFDKLHLNHLRKSKLVASDKVIFNPILVSSYIRNSWQTVLAKLHFNSPILKIERTPDSDSLLIN